MQLIGIFAVLLGGFLVIGTICAVAEDRKGRREDEAEELPRVVVSQQVPSVFDTFKGGKK